MSFLSTFAVSYPSIITYNVAPVSAVASINLSIKRINKLIITQNLSIVPINKPASGITGITVIDMWNAGSYTLSWDSTFEFPYEIVPAFSTNSWDRLVCMVHDGNKVWTHLVDRAFTP